MTPRFTILLILTSVLGCQASPMTTANVDEPKPAVPAVAAEAPLVKMVATAAPTPARVLAPAEPKEESPADHLAEAGRCLERDDLTTLPASIWQST